MTAGGNLTSFLPQLFDLLSKDLLETVSSMAAGKKEQKIGGQDQVMLQSVVMEANLKFIKQSGVVEAVLLLKG